MNNVYLFQPQFSNEFNGKTQYWLPYSAACLWAYTTLFDDIQANWQLKDIVFDRLDHGTVLENLDNPKVCGFSCYLWNEQYCLALAQLIKQKWPSCYIVFGGPQCGSDYLAHDYVDSVVMAEGEYAFVEILQTLQQNKIPEVLFSKKRVQSLDQLPSPYVLGLFDNLINQNPNIEWNAVLETNRGCPFQCTFCDWGGTTYSKVKKFDLDKIEQELVWMSTHNVSSIFVADANFGMFAERDMAIAKMIKQYSTSSKIDYVNITYTKNSNENVFKIAKELHPLTKAVTLSMQSMDSNALVAIKRSNMKINSISNMMELSQQYQIPTYTEMILGLPEETIESWKSGLIQLLEAGQHNQIDIFFVLLLKNSELGLASQKQKYGINTVWVDNYLLYSSDSLDSLSEKAELVSSTNTMSLDDLVESYMYGWLITNMHLAGYSQLIAKYCYYVHGISYRQYYDYLFEKITGSNTAISEDFQSMKLSITELLTTGKITTLPIRVNHIAFYSYIPLYLKKQQVIDLAVETAEHFGSVDSSVVELQNNFLYDQHCEFPTHVNCNYNIDTWQQQQSYYKISSRVTNFKLDYNHLSLQRKRGHLKNNIELVIN